MRRDVVIVVVLVVAVAAVGIVSVTRGLRRPGARAQMTEVVRELRTAADSCRDALDRGETSLLDYNARLDSLRSRVRHLESYDRRGVPADSYAIYMAVFEEYNTSAAAWQPHADTLQAQLARCRAVTEEHNVAVDSLRRIILEDDR